MKKMIQWMIAAILICGSTTFFASCVNDDNPVIVGGDMINPMPSESDIIGTWKVTNVTKGNTFQEGQLLVINANHTASYDNYYHCYGNWSLDKFDFQAELEGSAGYRFTFWFNMSLIKGEDNKIEVKGFLNLFEYDIFVHDDDVQFVLVKVEE